MKNVWLVEEHKPGYHSYTIKVFSTEQKAKAFIDKRAKKIMLNREEHMTIKTPIDEHDYVGIVWLDEDGNIEYDEYGCEIEHTYFFIYSKEVDEES